MKISGQAQGVIAFVGAIIVVNFLVRRALSDDVNSVLNVNEGTPFEGTGVVGTIGNLADNASAGVFSSIGSAIGEFFSGSFFDRRSLDDLTGT